MTPPVFPPPAVAGPPYFTDVPADYPWYPWIQKLWEIGVTSGETTDPPTFGPNDTMTRWEAAIFCIRVLQVAGLLPPVPPAEPQPQQP